MALDKVQPLKLEDPSTGGDDLDLFPTELDPLEDHVECRGTILANSTTRDDKVVLTRSGDDMTFQDGINTTPVTLSSLVTGVDPNTHIAFRQLIHFMEDGPADPALSGAVKEVLPSSGPFPTSVVWWTDGTKTVKYVEKLLTRDAQQRPTTVAWKMYGASGSLLATITDTVSYTGPFETSRTRVMS